MPNETELERASKQGAPSMWSEWLLVLLGALLLTSSPLAPFIYSVF